MTNYRYSYHPENTLVSCTRGLDMNRHQSAVLVRPGCKDAFVLQSVPNREALGVFHAVSTRDGEALARDGRAFYAINPLDSLGDEDIAEIQFGDGLWMLATTNDLEYPRDR